MRMDTTQLDTVCDSLLEAVGSPKKRLGLLGGTFNPVHYGHLNIALHAREMFSLHRVAFIPVGIPVHKPADLTPGEQRYEMVRLALEGTPLEVWDVEIRRPGPTFTVDTLEILTGGLGSEYEFFYIIGADTLMEIPTWRNFSRVLELCTFVVFYRPGQRVTDVMQQACMLTDGFGARICLAPHTGPDVSSTMIKRMARKGEDLTPWVPPAVARYIRENGLYRSAENG